MKLFLAFITIFFGNSIFYCQSDVDKLLLVKVNLLRDSLHLKPLQLDQALNKAGEDHAFYMADKKELTHFQLTYTKETPADRVYYYKGNRTYVGENVAQITAKFQNNKELNSAFVAAELFAAWFKSPKHYENMVHPEYTHMGLGIWYTKENRLFGAQLFSSNEIRLPSAFKNSELAWGVRSSEKTCKDEPQTYETMFFANSIIVEGSSVYFYFHDRQFFENVIHNDNDGIAIDVVLREQLPCDKENQFHISPIFDGEMQRPIYKNDLLRNNLSENIRKIKVKIGDVPSYLHNQQWEANVIIINDNKLCDYSYPIEVPSDIFPLLDIQPYFETKDDLLTNSVNSVIVRDSIHLVLDYERNSKRFSSLNSDEFERLLTWGNYLKNIQVNCFASVEGPLWLNEQLLEERKSSAINLLLTSDIDPNKARFLLLENWSMMHSQIEEHSLYHLNHKSDDQVKYILKTQRFSKQDSLLFEQRKTHVYAVVDTLIKIEDYPSYLFARYYDSTIQLNQMPWNKILREDYIRANNSIERELVDSLSTFKPLKTNLLGAICVEESYQLLDSALVEKLVKSIDTKNSVQVFNYAHFLSHYWFDHFARNYETRKVANTISPNDLQVMVDKIDTNLVKTNDLIRLKINLLLSGIHYYVAHNQWSPVESYFKTIVDLVKLENFTTQEAMELALFCNHFHKFKEAIEILHPFYEQRLLSENGYFVLAKTSTLIKRNLKREDYLGYMNAAKIANHKRYCQWLNDNFQIQRDEHIKDDFCKECH